MYLPTYLPCRANREANELSPTATTTKVCNVGRQHSVEAMACVTVDMIDSRTDRWESGLESRYSAIGKHRTHARDLAASSYYSRGSRYQSNDEEMGSPSSPIPRILVVACRVCLLSHLHAVHDG